MFKKAYTTKISRCKKLHEKKLNQDIENGKVIDWKKFKTLKKFYEPKNPLGLSDLLAFENFFKKLYEKDTKQSRSQLINSDSKTSPLSQNFDGLSCEIKLDEIDTAIKSLKLGKSCSLDMISNEFIKCLPQVGKRALAQLFNFCLSQGRYPWNSSVIVPIHKSGDKHNPDNYRAIGISSCQGKTFLAILLNRLLSFRPQNFQTLQTNSNFAKTLRLMTTF